MNDIDKLDTTQLVVFWNKLDDHFDTGLLSDEDAEDINKTIQALIAKECNKARQEEQERYQQALNAIVNLKHDYIKYERLIAELSNKENK
jgi:hypothetical protein